MPASLTPDLFWEPAIGEAVRLRPAARTGVKAYDDHPVIVRKADEMEGRRIYSIETTGPVTERVTASGRRVLSAPRWTTFAELDDLMPLEAA